MKISKTISVKKQKKIYSKDEVVDLIYKTIGEFTGTEEPHTESEAIRFDKKMERWVNKLLKQTK